MRQDQAQLLTITRGAIRPTEEGGSPAGKRDGMTDIGLQHTQLHHSRWKVLSHTGRKGSAWLALLGWEQTGFLSSSLFLPPPCPLSSVCHSHSQSFYIDRLNIPNLQIHATLQLLSYLKKNGSGCTSSECGQRRLWVSAPNQAQTVVQGKVWATTTSADRRPLA